MPIEFRVILRRLRKSPGFAAVALLTLALGIGANTAIFSVVNGILLKPLPFPDSDRLVALWMKAPGLNIPQLEMSPSAYFLCREETKTLDHVTIWQGDTFSVTGLEEPEEVDALVTTFDLLGALEVAPALGRGFTEADDKPGAPKTVLISHGYWMRKFGGNRNVIGKQLSGDSVPREIIGVLPENFHFLNRHPQIIAPFQLDRAKVFVGNFSFDGIARLKPGATVEQANADIARLLPSMVTKFAMPPGFSAAMFESAHISTAFRPLKQDVVGNISAMLWVLMGTIAMVLFIAGANVANLLLVRAEGRQHELSIRAALGASRGDLTRELLTESLLLALVGGLLGVGVAQGAIRWLVHLAPAGLPRLNEISIDASVALYTLAISLIAGLSFGLIPVLRYTGPRIHTSMRDGGRGSSHGRERLHARSVLVVVQVALALVLLVGAGLMIRTFQVLSHIEPGFQKPEELLTLRTSITEGHVKEPARVIAMMREMERRISEIPGVDAVSIGGSITMDGTRSGDPVFPEDQPVAEGKIPAIRRYKFSGPGMFKTMGNPLAAGRDFTWSYIENYTPVVMLSENLAKELWGSPAKAIGRRLRERPGGIWREVIGVVGNERDDGLTQPLPQIAYWPLVVKALWDQDMQIRRFPAFAVRSHRTGSQTFAHEVQQAIWSVDPTLTISRVKTVREIEDSSLAATSFTLVMLAIAGAMALLLGVIGIYGVIAYSVSQRTREIGIRTALGASAGELRAMFVKHALGLAAIGVGIGLAGALAATRLMTSLLYDISPRDPITFGLVPFVLLLAALAAAYLPARRATRVEPMEALRAD